MFLFELGNKQRNKRITLLRFEMTGRTHKALNMTPTLNALIVLT
jgi:hypothetical protein